MTQALGEEGAGQVWRSSGRGGVAGLELAEGKEREARAERNGRQEQSPCRPQVSKMSWGLFGVGKSVSGLCRQGQSGR